MSYGYKNLNEFILTGRYQSASLSRLMFEPYTGVFIQQCTVILGGMALTFGAGKIFIFIFACIQIFFTVFLDFDSTLKNIEPDDNYQKSKNL